MSSLQRKGQPFLHLGATSGGESITLTGVEFERFKWVQGISGSGKSTFLAWIVISLLRLAIPVALIDPHSDLCRLVLNLLAQTDFFKSPLGFERLHFIDFARLGCAPPFNVLRQEHIDNYKVAQNILEAIHRAFPSSSGTTAALDNTITYASFVLAENGQPITQLQRFLLDKSFRDRLLARIKDQQITQFFDYKFSDKVNSQLIDSTMRRLDLLTFSPTLRASLGQKGNILNFRNMWDKDISCLISLGGLTENEKRLLGCLLLVSIEQAFLSRLDLPPKMRSKVCLIVDEAPLFISQDETSFTNILEQCRKAGATCTTFANQTLTQLSKGMLGSLQNTLPIIMKAGSQDSSELASRFYRPSKSEQSFDLFGLQRRSPGVFDSVQNTTEARMIFEGLARQEAIVVLPNRAVKIKTPTIPVNIDQERLEEIEAVYARRILTPLSQIDREQASSSLVLVKPLSSSIANRRVPRTSSDLTPFQTFAGASGTDEQLVSIFTQYGYLTVAMAAKLLGKTQNTARNKLKSLVDCGVLETQSLPRTTPSGKTPLVYSLKKGVRKYEFLEHSLATSAVLLNAALLPTAISEITITDLQSDQHFKASPIKLASGTLVPDGMVRLVTQDYEYAVYFEIDRNTESREKICAKLQHYITLTSQCECMAVAFCVVEGADLRVKTLRNWACDVIPEQYRELFLFAPIDIENLTPNAFYLSPIWSSVGETTLQALIEL